MRSPIILAELRSTLSVSTARTRVRAMLQRQKVLVFKAIKGRATERPDD
jgi:hypothetical protein